MNTALMALVALAAIQRPVEVRAIDGRAWMPLSPGAGQTHLLLFVDVDCPVSNRYAPEIARIAADYQSAGVRTFLVYADASLTADRVRAHLGEFFPSAKLPAFIDTGSELTSRVGATVTPEATIYTSQGRVYRGRIDDLYVSLGQTRREATRRDLRLSLDAVLAGTRVPIAETKAVGCYIERKDR